MSPELEAAGGDVTLAIRADIEKRDWRRMHTDADRRKPVNLPDRPRAASGPTNLAVRIVQTGRNFWSGR